MASKLKDLVGSDIWLNRLIKDPDHDVFQAEKGEKDEDPENIRPGLIPKNRPKKGGRMKRT
jgi:hypothetical protein